MVKFEVVERITLFLERLARVSAGRCGGLDVVRVA